MDRRSVLALLVCCSACRNKEPGESTRSAAAIDASSVRAVVHDAGIATAAALSSGWIDRCLGELAVAGHAEDAEVLRAELAPRLARALGG